MSERVITLDDFPNTASVLNDCVTRGLMSNEQMKELLQSSVDGANALIENYNQGMPRLEGKI